MLKQMKEMKGNQRYVLANNDKPLSENAMLYAVKRFDTVTVQVSCDVRHMVRKG